MFTIPRGRPSAPQSLDCLNWPAEFPYKPEVAFRIWTEGPDLCLEYTVNELTTRALEATPGNFVYEDSCVEFFVRPDLDAPWYYNFEWNAAGTLYLARRTGRGDPVHPPREVLSLVTAESSLGPAPIEETALGVPWSLKIRIPARALWAEGIDSWKGRTMAANLYKCGDGLTTPHYLSWAPVRTEAPDYHRPEFFVPVQF